MSPLKATGDYIANSNRFAVKSRASEIVSQVNKVSIATHTRPLGLGQFQSRLIKEQLITFKHFAGLAPDDVDPRTLPQWPVWLKHCQSLRSGDAPFRHEDGIERVRTFEKPVLLVKGEGSNPGLHAIIDVLAEEFPNARVASFPGGHAAHIVSMQPFLERFTRFLSERNPA